MKIGKLEIAEQRRVSGATLSLLENGVCHVLFDQHLEITIDLQNELLAVYIEFARGGQLPCIFESHTFISLDKKARENALKMEDEAPLNANAIIVKNAAHKVLAEFYNFVNKPKCPYRIFTSVDKAQDWIEQFVER